MVEIPLSPKGLLFKGVYIMLKRKEYLNWSTGEVVMCFTLRGARRYFKKDAKKYKYEYKDACITLARYWYEFGL